MNISPEALRDMDPQTLFVNLTAAIYDARGRGDLQEIEGILSAFEPDARRALCVGAAAMRIMKGTNDKEYRDAIMSSMSETLYNELKEART